MRPTLIVTLTAFSLACDTAEPVLRALLQSIERTIIGEVMPSVPANASKAILVLGYRLNADGTPSALLRQRVDDAQAHIGDGAMLIFSGGVPRNFNGSEAAALLRYSKLCHSQHLRNGRRRNLRPHQILLEERSRSTRENALETIKLLTRRRQRLRLQRGRALALVVVTNPFHRWRACRAFQRAAQGIDWLRLSCARTQPSLRAPPTRSINDSGPTCGGSGSRVDARELLWATLREAAAIVYYFLRGWL
jgi:uncharacterized SAM-binding protein YcdF (DUF218 family)